MDRGQSVDTEVEFTKMSHYMEGIQSQLDLDILLQLLSETNKSIYVDQTRFLKCEHVS